VTSKEGLGKELFCDWRKTGNFVLDSDEAKGAHILVAGDNFGCGSSREHAPWALTDYGFRAVVSTSFADIFKGNALKNGLLPIVVSKETLAYLFEARASDPALTITIDLASQTLTLPNGEKLTFPVDPFSKHCLLNGIDELGYILSFKEKIEAHERAHSHG